MDKLTNGDMRKKASNSRKIFKGAAMMFNLPAVFMLLALFSDFGNLNSDLFALTIIFFIIGITLGSASQTYADDEKHFAKLDPDAPYVPFSKPNKNISEISLNSTVEDNETTRQQISNDKEFDKPAPSLKVQFHNSLSITDEGKAFKKEVDKANDLIEDKKISEDLYAICRHINDIFATAANDSSAEREIKKFSGIYLPKMLKLCNLYIELDAKQVQTQKVLGLKEQIGASIANIRCAFANFNDNLINRASIDIEAEIQSFEELLTIDGLLGRRELVLPEKTAEKDKV